MSQLQYEQGNIRNLSSQIKRQHRLWWQSSYNRGLDTLLFMWPDIKKVYPDAELWISYGWQVFDMMFKDNPEKIEWKRNLTSLMNQPGITHFGRVSKEQLRKLRQQSGIWAYSTSFPEICCLSALECQNDGVVPATVAYAALKETVGSGFTVAGDIYEKGVRDTYLKELLKLMGDEQYWREEQKKLIFII